MICSECQDEFDPNDPARIKLGGKKIHCGDCCQETATKYLGLQAGDGKQTQVQICVVKKKETSIVSVRGVETPIERFKWMVDNEIPIFHEDKTYIEKYLYGEDYFKKIKAEYEKLKPLFEGSK